MGADPTTLATKLVLLPPKDPESVGVAERRNGWFETSFMPGRSFASPAELDAQFADGLAGANARTARTTKAAPVERVSADRAATLRSPPIPLHLGWRNRLRLGRDYYVRLDTTDHSVDPTVIGRLVEVTADLEPVRVRADGRTVADHARIWACGTTLFAELPVPARRCRLGPERRMRSCAGRDGRCRSTGASHGQNHLSIVRSLNESATRWRRTTRTIRRRTSPV